MELFAQVPNSNFDVYLEPTTGCFWSVAKPNSGGITTWFGKVDHIIGLLQTAYFPPETQFTELALETMSGLYTAFIPTDSAKPFCMTKFNRS